MPRHRAHGAGGIDHGQRGVIVGAEHRIGRRRRAQQDLDGGKGDVEIELPGDHLGRRMPRADQRRAITGQPRVRTGNAGDAAT